MTGSDRLVQNPLGPAAVGVEGSVVTPVIEMARKTYSRGLGGEPGSPPVAHDLCSTTLGASACHSDPVIFSGGEEGKGSPGFFWVTPFDRDGEKRGVTATRFLESRCCE